MATFLTAESGIRMLNLLPRSQLELSTITIKKNLGILLRGSPSDNFDDDDMATTAGMTERSDDDDETKTAMTEQK